MGDTDAAQKACEKFVCDLHWAKQAMLKNASLPRLPPCQNAVIQQMLQAHWQSQVWLSSRIPKPEIPSPIGHGWKKDPDHVLLPHLIGGCSASELLEDLLCTYPSHV